MKPRNQRFDPCKAGIEIDEDGQIDALMNSCFQMQAPRATWKEARKTLEVESGILSAFKDERLVNADFSAMTSMLRGDEGDIGMKTVVAALQAAGCLTVSNCSGRFSFGENDADHNEECPCVAFYASPGTAAILKRLAGDAGLSIGYLLSGERKPIIVQARPKEVTKMMIFAKAIIKADTEFDALGEGKSVVSNETFRLVWVAMDQEFDGVFDESDLEAAGDISKFNLAEMR